MFWKLLVMMAVLAAVGAGLLGLRGQRQHLRHEITEFHVQMDASRRQTWDMQVRIAERTDPGDLREAVRRAGLELEPIEPAERRRLAPPDDRMAEADSYGR